MITRAQDREMILTPTKWPNLALPLKNRTNGKLAVFAPPVSVYEIDPNEPITILIGNMFQPLIDLPRETYNNVDALLDDGWVVD